MTRLAPPSHSTILGYVPTPLPRRGTRPVTDPTDIPSAEEAFRQLCRAANRGTEPLGGFLEVDPETGRRVMYLHQLPNQFSRHPQVIAVEPERLEVMVAYWLIDKYNAKGAVSSGVLTPPGSN
jgi:hypothetical protein